jgi:peptidoglycan hydrolase-like protein with peptidoglycan-binding domain
VLVVRRRPLSVVGGLAALTILVAGCTTAEQAAPVAERTPVTSASPEPVELETAAEVVEEAAEPEESPAPSPSAAPVSASPAAVAAAGYDVAAVQRALTDQKYYIGAVDGKAGPTLRSAVMAFQKVNGLPADGVVGKGTLAALAAPRAPVLKASAPANRVEVDLTKQVLYVVKGGAVARVLPVSSGNGATYLQKDGTTARALTPVGWYTIQRRIVGERKADLGTLYDPQYFYKGWAIHGSNSVPAVPASHGCIRVTRTDGTWLLKQIGIGTSVYLYGGTHVFTAGSSAPGTDAPTGDTAGTTTTSPSADTSSPSPSPSPSASPSPSPTASPSPSSSPSPSGTTPPSSETPSSETSPSPSGEPSSSPAGVGEPTAAG